MCPNPTPSIDLPAAERRRLPPGLYIVAGPIGNLEDLSGRAARWLREADVIACEDTRVTAKLLRAAGSDRPMIRHDDHSSADATHQLVDRATSQSVVLVSDAGTPLISDPGHELVREARAKGVNVTTAPGPSAAIAALSISSLPGNRFFFAGFLPAKAAARRRQIAALAAVPATLIFYESARRIAATVQELADALGPRPAAIVRELTKLHEDYLESDLVTLAAQLQARPLKGEIVLLVGPPAEETTSEDALDQALLAALQSLSTGRAAASVAAALGLPRARVYARALELQGK